MTTVEKGRILVVDDEAYITDLVSMALKLEGFETSTASNGAEALGLVSDNAYDLVILDVMLPDIEGTEVCRLLRSGGHEVAVLFLTARDATEDTVAGLKAGGDDYMTKPFSLEELVARIQAVLRRTRSASLGGSSRLVFEDLVFDEDTFEVWRNGSPISLTATELRLLHLLISNSRRVLSKSQILQHVWGYEFEGDPNIVETYISYLRKKVDCFDPPLIQTIRGLGYSLRLP
jgi:two-component system OmpR family response regulator